MPWSPYQRDDGGPWILMQKGPGTSPSGVMRLQPSQMETPSQDFSRALLKENCASLDAHGNMEAVYIAPRVGCLPWDQLRQLPIHVEGLESSWTFDASLDHKDMPNAITATPTKVELRTFEEQRAASLSGASPQSSSSKRSMSDLTRSTCITSMSSTTAAEQGRAKRARTCMTAMIGVTTGSDGCRAL